jgi:simple sugar transport system ATP-binding protein
MGENTGPLFAEMRGVTKIFPENGVTANNQVDFELRQGEVHALVGENGSGKSTLMHLLSGLLTPDEGQLFVGGAEVGFSSPEEALEHGIGMVHQHLKVVKELSVWENVVLGHEPRTRWGMIDSRAGREAVRDIGREYGIEIDPDRQAGSLSVDGLQKSSLLALLYRRVKCLILDEPTTVFSERQTESLYALIRTLARQGHTVVLITHKLRDALTLADRITVMRGGRRITTRSSADLSAEELSSLIMGGEYLRLTRREEANPGRRVLELEEITCSEPGYPPLRGLSFSVRRGEAVAVTGIRENGLETLEHLLSGSTPPDTGTIRYDGSPLQRLTPALMRRRGIAYIPTERLVRGASIHSSVAENMILLNYRDFHAWGRLKRDEIEHYTGELQREFRIKGEAGDTLRGLSGGNIQKVIISREMAGTPALLIFSEPSWGLDVRSVDFIYDKIAELKRRNSAVLIITSDVDEAIEFADRIVVMYRGRKTAECAGSEASRESIGRWMLGLDGNAAAGETDAGGSSGKAAAGETDADGSSGKAAVGDTVAGDTAAGEPSPESASNKPAGGTP